MKLPGLLLSAILLAQTPQQNVAGTVQGTIIRAGTTDGLADVRVDLLPVSVQTLQDFALPPAPGPTAISDSTGHFVMRNVTPGRYGIRILSNGYSGAPTNTTTVSVTDGGITDVNLSAIPGAIIRGRVLDSSGQLLSNVNVQAFQLVYQNGFPYLQSSVSKMTDDRGEYRLFGVPPGDYYVGVTPRPPLANTTPGTGTVRDVRTYSPTADNPASATKITINGGEELTNVNVAMRSALQVRVSGRVITQVAPPAPVTNDPNLPGVFAAIANAQMNSARLQLVPRDASMPMEADGGLSAAVLLNASSGEFEIPNVAPGSYDLFAIATAQSGIAFGRVAINVASEDVTGLSVVLRSGVEVRGSVIVDGNPGTQPMNIGLQAADSLARAGFGYFQRPLSPESSPAIFVIPSVPEGRFRMTVGTNPTQYVEDILQNGRSVYDAGFEVGPGSPDAIQIVMKSGAAIVNGTVVDASDKPVAAATVALIPTNRRDNPGLYWNISTDATGNFSLRGVAPGEYKIFAWPGSVNGAFYNSSFLARFEESGQPITVSANGKATIRLSLASGRQ